MLQLRDLCKEYRTENLVQKALDHVSLNLRDNEFVAILGPSGSGKTTLLNIIGGLDRYDSGDLIINGISTRKYRERDWDSYRNHTIGFVFQSYNLIPHQTVLANVELALTISGVGKSERKKRAVQALNQVGLGEQLHKKPHQMSGGQMQRVAIARALVNDPDILLADEPTGALDSSTSIQVMELLKEVAKDRLVVMVTHNPELAQQYATRIVSLRDGKIRSDSDPFEPASGTEEPPVHRNMGKSSMSFATALSLSFHNLKTKKARTLLTSFAGSIGIIGIALILSLSSGVNAYIKNVEHDTLSQYPLEIQSTGFDFTSMLNTDHEGDDSSSGQIGILNMVTNMFSTMASNDLRALKTYLDSGQSGMEAYTSAIEYSYGIMPQIFRLDDNGIRQVNPDTSFAAMGLGSTVSSNSMMSSMMGTDVFYEMPENEDLYLNQYELKAGHWPRDFHECVLVLTSGGSISDFMLYTLGLRDSAELDQMVDQFVKEESVQVPDNTDSYDYEDILGITFRLVRCADYYEYDQEYGVWKDKTDDEAYMRELVEQGEELTIVGIVQPLEDAGGLLQTGIAYPPSLTRHVAQLASESEIVQSQLAAPDINVFTGSPFGEESEENSFDMESLFHIDEQALEDLFSFDEEDMKNSLKGSLSLSESGNPDMSGTDLSEFLDTGTLESELPDFPELNLSDLLKGIEFQTSPEKTEALISELMKGWKEYSAEHPEADFSGLNEDFQSFLQTETGKEILSQHLREILDANGMESLTNEQISILLSSIMAGFTQYCEDNQIDPSALQDPEFLQSCFLEYLGSESAQTIIAEWRAQFLPELPSLTITPEQLESLAKDLAEGYQNYAADSGLADPSRIGEYFSDYMSSEQARDILKEGVASMIDTSGLQVQLASAMKGYMSSFSDSFSDILESIMSSVMEELTDSIQASMEKAMKELGSKLSESFRITPEDFASVFSVNMNADELAELLRSLSSARDAGYENNLASLGWVDFDNPSVISIYPLDFESKGQVTDILNQYNSRMEAEGKEEQVISYTDMVGTLMSSVTDIIDIISYVLIAFVAISLVVSSIMIGVITYISVLERKKEIGILRAIGASRQNISQVFNAETFIIGLAAGLIGILLTLLLLIPANSLIHHLAGSTDVNAFLPAGGALILIVLSVLLTLLGGLIPSGKASRSDPVAALRAE